MAIQESINALQNKAEQKVGVWTPKDGCSITGVFVGVQKDSAALSKYLPLIEYADGLIVALRLPDGLRKQWDLHAQIGDLVALTLVTEYCPHDDSEYRLL